MARQGFRKRWLIGIALLLIVVGGGFGLWTIQRAATIEVWTYGYYVRALSHLQYAEHPLPPSLEELGPTLTKIGSVAEMLPNNVPPPIYRPIPAQFDPNDPFLVLASPEPSHWWQVFRTVAYMSQNGRQLDSELWWWWRVPGLIRADDRRRELPFVVAKQLGLELSSEARGLRFEYWSAFTFGCYFRFDLPNEQLQAYLAAAAVLPKLKRLRHDPEIAAELRGMGGLPDWWNLVDDLNVLYGKREGLDATPPKPMRWWSTVAIVPLADDRSRVFILYIEEAAKAAGPFVDPNAATEEQ